MKTDLALNINNVTKIYSTGIKAVDNISFKVKKGDFLALLGPNGAGKSTTLGMISSLINITKGDIEIFGNSIKTNRVRAKKYLGTMQQEFNINFFRTPIQIMLNQAGYYGIPRKTAIIEVESLLKKMQLWDKRNTQGRFLSGGMKRRLMVARALVHKPKLLILDEPTAGVDVELRQSLWEQIKQFNSEGMTIILTTHYLEEAENLCNRIVLINNGKINTSTDMKSLLKSLEKETYIIDLKNPFNESELHLPIGKGTFKDPHTLQFTVSKGVTLSSLFNYLAELKLEVISIKPHKTRLEQLFIDIVNSKTKS